jgi:crotonobetainyl-CoA:carnitine CoA-transferase CaiB-like acyl-CoA transferase
MTAQGPLVGLKVVELAHIMAGPVCGLMLADMGASVIKVEKIPGGDDSRRFLPPAIGGESAAFMMMNRNKRGIALDLKHPAGKNVLRRLLADADVLIENYRSDTMAKLGFGYEDLRKSNPGLIYCALSGFGRTGPYAELGGFDLIAQGMSGLMSITGEAPGRQPVKSGAPVTDITAGILAAMGVLAAYVHRLKTGEGQMVDTSLFEAGITHTYWQSAIALATGIAPGPMGSAHPLNGPYQAFEASDGWITVGAGNQANWLRMLAAMELRELADDPRFADNATRMKHLDALVARLSARFAERSAAGWLQLFAAVGVPAGPVLDVKQMHDDPQTQAREMLVEVEHPKAGRVKAIGLPVKFSATPGKVAHAAPVLGEHSRDILEEYGYSSEEIERLAAERAVLLGE